MNPDEHRNDLCLVPVFKVVQQFPRRSKLELDLARDGETSITLPTDPEIAVCTDLPWLREVTEALRRVLRLVQFEGVVGRSLRRSIGELDRRIDELAAVSPLPLQPAPEEPSE